MNCLKATMLKVWNPGSCTLTNHLHQNIMPFIFESHIVVHKIQNLYWFFSDAQVILRLWPPDKSISKIDLTKIPNGLQIFNLSACLSNPQYAEKSVTDPHSTIHIWKRSFRVNIFLDTTKHVIGYVTLARPRGAGLKYSNWNYLISKP
ncbi:hypothetical protein ABFX02_12G053000 [Erythranthe guttata]